MTTQANTVLAYLDPTEITTEVAFLNPSDWDRRVIQDDLNCYVALSRLIKATPKIAFHNEKFVVINGLPFLEAARVAVPPIKRIVCSLQMDVQVLKHKKIEVVTARELLNIFPEHKIYTAVELLSFCRSLDQNEKAKIELAISTFFQEMIANPSYGGHYRLLYSFNWMQLDTQCTWRWERSDSDGTHLLRFFLILINSLSTYIVSIRSWNGHDVKIREDDGHSRRYHAAGSR